MNFLKRFAEFIASPSNSRTTSLLVILIIALSIPFTVFVAQKQQDLRQYAASTPNTDNCIARGGTCLGTTCLIDNDPSGSCDVAAPVCDPKTEIATKCEPDCSIPSNCGKETTCVTSCGRTGVPGKCDACPASTPAPPATQAPTQAPATSAPAVGGPAGVCKGPADKGAIATCDPSKDIGKTRTSAQRCRKLCPDGKTVVSGISREECQSDFCWYDSLYDLSKGNEKQRYDGFCYYGPTNDPKEAGCPVTPTFGGLTPEQCAGVGGVCAPNTASCTGSIFGTCAGGTICCRVTCTVENAALRTPCQAAANTCSGAGTQTKTLDSGVASCNPVIVPGQACNNAPANCTSPNICSNGQCIPQDTEPPEPGNTLFSFTLGLNGLGKTGDSKSPDNFSGSTENPRRQTRSIKVEVFELNQTRVKKEQNGDIDFDTPSGKFKGIIDMGSLATGNYTVKVRSNSYFRKTVTPNIFITAGQTIELPSVNLITGDIDGNNRHNVSDYNILRDCFRNDSCSQKDLADLDDDGDITLSDLNLFLREFPIQSGD